MAWVEAPENDRRLLYLNLQRAQQLVIKPNTRVPGEWVVLARFGSGEHYVDSFPSRVEAAEWVADLLFEDDDQ